MRIRNIEQSSFEFLCRLVSAAVVIVIVESVIYWIESM
jgi:hypothetical protein